MKVSLLCLHFMCALALCNMRRALQEVMRMAKTIAHAKLRTPYRVSMLCVSRRCSWFPPVCRKQSPVLAFLSARSALLCRSLASLLLACYALLWPAPSAPCCKVRSTLVAARHMLQACSP